MTPQFLHLHPYLAARDRPIRPRPTEVSTSEYIMQMGRLAAALENLTKVGATSPASIHLSRLTELSIEVLATYAMLGLEETYALGIFEACRRPISSPTPDYRLVLDKAYPEDDDDFPPHTD
jgi:hypothetical protein